jgi:hypothetical protein
VEGGGAALSIEKDFPEFFSSWLILQTSWLEKAGNLL